MQSGATPSGRSRVDWLAFLLAALVVVNLAACWQVDRLAMEAAQLRREAEQLRQLVDDQGADRQ